MRNYIILNGQNSNSISGLLIQSLAPISKPQMRTQIEEIDGRPGDIVTDLGFSSYDKEITIGLYGNFDINEVIAYFNSQGVVTFSNEPDKYYNYKIYDQIDFERLVRYRTATVTMHCQPFKYSTIEQPDIMSPTDNLLTISNWTRTTNGVTITAKDGTITVTGTPTAATEFYLPINALTLPAGMFTLTATASGQNPNYCSIRMIGSAPSDSDSFGGKYITLVQGTTTLSATLSASKTYNYIWFYMNAGTPLGFTLNLSVEDEAAKVVSDEGTNLVLEGSQLAPFSQFDLKGNTEQDTLSGKNLFDSSTIVVGDVQDANTTIRLHSSQELWLDAGTYTFSTNLPTPLRFSLSTTPTGAPPYATWPTWDYSSGWKDSERTVTFTLTQGGYFNCQFSKQNNAELTLDEFSGYNYQLEKSSQATDFEPYCGGISSPNPDYPQDVRVVTGENTVKITGKNILRMTDWTQGGLTSTYDSTTGVLTTRGTTTNAWPSLADRRDVAIPSGSRITFSVQKTYPANFAMRLYYSANDYESIALVAGQKSSSRTVSHDIQRIYLLYNTGLGAVIDETFQFQLEYGSATDFEPYQEQSYPLSLGSLEFCAIDNYVDEPVKIGDKWYKRKAVKKVVFDGSEAWSKSNNVFVNSAGYTDLVSAEVDGVALCNGFSFWKNTGGISTNMPNLQFGFPAAKGSIDFRYDALSTASDWKTWLASNNVTIYYALATPVDEEITNSTLIEQLDNIYYHAHAYKERTHVSSLAADGNVPHIIAAAVAQNNDGVVTNSGNYFSKPRLTIYGEGEIGVYLNGIQIFQIALGSEGYITIDTAALEAYKDTTDNLKNRLVTGDYENFALRPGENQLSFSGSVTKCVVENYSRWL